MIRKKVSAKTFILLALVAFLLFPHGLAASNPGLELPIICPENSICFVQNYFDLDPGPEYRDFRGGLLSYDNHTGTDIRISPAMMRSGVTVLAAAPGVVKAVRDGMKDVSVRDIGLKAVLGRGAGNGVLVDHGNGWQTQYNHLRQGSLMVRIGDRVMTGQPLGLVGLSGKTEFPHLEFIVRRNGRAICPYAGTDRKDEAAASLWSSQASNALPYKASGLLGNGFTTKKPDIRSVLNGKHQLTTLSPDSAIMIFWGAIWGAQKGDIVRISIIGPDGRVVAEHAKTLSKNQAQRFGFVGKRRPKNGWPTGEYRGKYELLRGRSGKKRVIVWAVERIRVNPGLTTP